MTREFKKEKLSGVKCSILKASQIISVMNKPRQFAAKPYNFFMIRGKREREWRNKETCGNSEVSSNLGEHSIVFCPKGSGHIFSKPCRHEYHHDSCIKSCRSPELK